MLERDYQAKLIKKIRKLIPGCLIQKLDTEYQAGIPDLLILFGPKWAILEVKKSLKDRNNPEPNQEYFVDLLNAMSYSAFIYPENEKEVLRDLQQALLFGRAARISKRKQTQLDEL